MIKTEEVREYRLKDADRFRELLEDQEYTYRTFSNELQKELRKKRKSTLGTSKSTVANLASGDQVVVRRDVAYAIKDVLRLKKLDRLFADDLYTVQRETGHRRVA